MIDNHEEHEYVRNQATRITLAEDRPPREVFHQLRNALTSVVGYLELVMMFPSIAPEQRQAYLTAALNHAREIKIVLNGFDPADDAATSVPDIASPVAERAESE